MKQNFPPARSNSLRISVRTLAMILALTLHSSACLTPSRHSIHLTQAHPEKQITKEASRININLAGAQELEKLPGVGKVTAERIIDHRRQYGAFRRAEHLIMVRGISDRKFRDMRALIATE